MTTLYASYQTDLDSYNLNYWYANLDFDEFNDNANVGGYEDNYFLYVGGDALGLYGSGFQYTGSDMNIGTIEGMSQWVWVVDAGLTDGGYWDEGWHWEGWNLDMSAFFDAGATPGTDDDLELIKTVMNDDDLVYLSDFNDSFAGFKGNDSLYGGDGHDTLYGYNGNDFLFGGRHGDEIYGGHDGDTLSGAHGEDYLDGGTGDDLIRGGRHSDTLVGGSGNDTLEAGAWGDQLFGNYGSDDLDGGSGEDTLRGGNHRDLLTGGRHSDTFLFMEGDDKDVIRDFDARGTVQDVVDLTDFEGISSFGDLLGGYMQVYGSHRVEFDFGGGDILILRFNDNFTNVSQLDADNFLLA